MTSPTASGKTILVVEDERVLREALAGLLEPEGYRIVQAENGAKGRDLALSQSFDCVLTDVRMPEMDGLTLLGHLRQIAPETPVIVMTAFGTVDNAVQAMRSGAWDYLLKPVQFEDLLAKIERALEFSALKKNQTLITEQLAAGGSFENIVSEAPGMQRLFEQVKKLSTVKSSVLIVGESGTGKELFARAIHYNGPTRTKPFVPVNCGAIPESLIESELFGHRKGSFTGALRDKTGYFEAANGGTLFLDEISTLPKNVQATLLRVLEDRTVVPVGDTRARPIDVRVIAASNVDLEELVRKGDFREDLLFRLNVVKLLLPPLRQRQGDIPLLVHHFLARYSAEMNREIKGISNGAMRAMLDHEWRGNVRELKNIIERAVIFADGREIRVEDLPFAAGASDAIDGEGGGGDDANREDLKESLRQFERQHILHSLRRHNYDKTETAQHLGIGVSSLYRKMDELGIPKSAGDIEPNGT
ncbi:MAG: sigma-54-dependent Fis family transcriptional regulator [Phycisphaerae bacterium]|jgi:DNA-binding NtrC family response regulator|nr:sigma-54-dependent Fis family transcriptional regulator [Phycisphaerae bacterium]